MNLFSREWWPIGDCDSRSISWCLRLFGDAYKILDETPRVYDSYTRMCRHSIPSPWPLASGLWIHTILVQLFKKKLLLRLKPPQPTLRLRIERTTVITCYLNLLLCAPSTVGTGINCRFSSVIVMSWTTTIVVLQVVGEVLQHIHSPGAADKVGECVIDPRYFWIWYDISSLLIYW